MDTDCSSMCVSARGETATDAESEDEMEETDGRREKGGQAIAIAWIAGWKGEYEEMAGGKEGRREGGMKRGRMAVRRTWWTVYGCQEEPMASHMHLTSPRYTSESKQPYKVAGLRFNPKFISSISKGLSRAPRPSE